MNRNAFGFLVGLSAGVGVGLLLAPRAGEKTRLLIRRKAVDGAAYLRERGTEVRDAAADAIREQARKVTQGTEAVKAAVNAGRQAFTESMHS
jgi:gas vesicle protein